MFWIHGGGWFMGSGNGEKDFHGPHHFMDEDIVLVTINYRLGPFGIFPLHSNVFMTIITLSCCRISKYRRRSRTWKLRPTGPKHGPKVGPR